ncbi:tellurite resistance TerB C-terminal domain-containing protein [Emticicia fontis]
MTAIIIIGIVIFIIYSASNNKKPALRNKSYTNPDYSSKSGKGVEGELRRNHTRKFDINVTTSSSSRTFNDDSVIDISNLLYKIDSEFDLKTYEDKVPYWKHHYVYSYSEIVSATNEQKNFYEIFKSRFLHEEYLDLEGNTNYAFILLFDLLNEYDHHKDIPKVEKQLRILGKYYPKTKPYGIPFLTKKIDRKGYYERNSRIHEENVYSYQNYNTDYDYWKTGSKYKTKLNLNEEEVKLLNKLWYPNNNFCSIEYCYLEVLKLFIYTISALKDKYAEEGTSLDVQFLHVADVIAKKQFNYRRGSQNYKYIIENTTNEFYSHIFKYCENSVREYYGHKRKISTDTNYAIAEAKVEFDTKIISKVTELLPALITKVSLPDEATDIELYNQNTSRWRIRFEELTEKYQGKPREFFDSILALGRLNKHNPSIENIFFEASKFIAKHSSEIALSFYVYYIYYDLQSATFDNRQLTKTIQKSLFKTNEQLHTFEKVVSELIRDKNLDKALNDISKIYEVKRKKIQLDTTIIKQVQQQHSGTVEILNEYLNDDFDDETTTIRVQEINTEEIKIDIYQKNTEAYHSAFMEDLGFRPIQILTLEVFQKNNLSVAQTEIEVFAKSKGLFKNQIIDSINDTCYEFLDDVLIEEDDDYYTINPNYFQRISIK